MSKRIKGITIEIDGSTKKLSDALKGVEKNSRDIQSELKDVERLLKLDPKNTELLAQKQKLLADAVNNSRERLDALKDAQKQAEQAFKEGKIGEDQYRAIQREVIAAEQELKKLEKQLSEVNNKWKQAAEGVAEFGKKSEAIGKKMLPVTGAITAVGAGAFYTAMELEATEAKYNTVFGEFTNTADDFLTKFQKLTPATTAEARNMASGIQDLLVPMGFMRDEATNMTGELMHAIGALANFNSGTETAESVTTKINAALTGEYSSLKALGIQLDANTVKQKAVEMGLASSVKEVTKQHQAQVVLAEIYEQSSDALAAYTEENLDSKTKMALFTKDVQNLAAELGVVLLPVISQLLDAARSFIERFKGMDEGTKKLIITVLAIIAAIGPLLIIVGKVAGAISAIMGLMTTLAPVLAVVKGAFIAVAGAITWPIVAIAALIAAGILLWKNWDKVKEFAGRLKDAVVSKFAELRDGVVNWITNLREAVTARFTAIRDSAVERIKGLWEGIKQVFLSFLKGGIIGLINDYVLKPFLGIDLFKIGRDIVQGLINGIKNMAGNVAGAIRDVANNAINAAKNFLGIKSPSRVFEQLGKFTGEGFAEGIEATKRTISQAAQSISEAAQSGAGDARMYHDHGGVLTVRGVNDRGELVAVIDMRIMDVLRREARR